MNLHKTHQKPTVGVSSCLLGHAVRYDGKHKYQSIIATQLSHHFTLIPFCPEVAIGMGVPRPPIHLVDINNKIHAVDIANSAFDYTQQLSLQANKYLANIDLLQGYIFQDKSPSCGVSSVKIHNEKGTLISKQGAGIFAAKLIHLLPSIPTIEARHLDHNQAIASFVQQVYNFQP